MCACRFATRLGCDPALLALLTSTCDGSVGLFSMHLPELLTLRSRRVRNEGVEHQRQVHWRMHCQ
eukprot:2306824-Pleurochrysis_carterae.AAC.6